MIISDSTYLKEKLRNELVIGVIFFHGMELLEVEIINLSLIN